MPNSRFYILFVLQLLAACVLLGAVFYLPGAWDVQRTVGTIFVLVGVGGIVVARVQLGTSFSIKPKARKLVTSGVYSKIRNPIYVFGTVLFSALVLVAHRPALWVFVVLMVAVQMVRAHREAQVLETAFGEDYREYRRKTWF
jgi:protein-S-isoprenylcysteine O-methyltransferase Ste14